MGDTLITQHINLLSIHMSQSTLSSTRAHNSGELIAQLEVHWKAIQAEVKQLNESIVALFEDTIQGGRSPYTP